MELIFIRHGQPAWSVDGLNKVDPYLSDLGHAQARLMAERVAAEHHEKPFTELFVSPMLRARQTIAPLLELLERDELRVEWLHELKDDPSWDNAPRELVTNFYAEEQRRAPWDRWDLPTEGLAAGSGGESFRVFTQRIREGAAAFLADHGVRRVDHELPLWDIDDPTGKLGFICHGGTTAVSTAWLLGMAPVPWEWDRLQIAHASITRLVAVPTGDHYSFGLQRLSDNEHLAPDQRTS
jgi:broad specificity phosphatase PhoE